jgi:uridine kinase
MVRDSWHRHYMPVQTVGHWHYVRRSEMKYIVPFIKNVDYIFNGSLPYELTVHKKYLYKYRDEILRAFENEPKRFDAFIRASRIYDLLGSVEEIRDESAIPEDSLMREFVGGSKYKY